MLSLRHFTNTVRQLHHFQYIRNSKEWWGRICRWNSYMCMCVSVCVKWNLFSHDHKQYILLFLHSINVRDLVMLGSDVAQMYLFWSLCSWAHAGSRYVTFETRLPGCYSNRRSLLRVPYQLCSFFRTQNSLFHSEPSDNRKALKRNVKTRDEMKELKAVIYWDASLSPTESQTELN